MGNTKEVGQGTLKHGYWKSLGNMDHEENTNISPNCARYAHFNKKYGETEYAGGYEKPNVKKTVTPFVGTRGGSNRAVGDLISKGFNQYCGDSEIDLD